MDRRLAASSNLPSIIQCISAQLERTSESNSGVTREARLFDSHSVHFDPRCLSSVVSEQVAHDEDAGITGMVQAREIKCSLQRLQQ